MIIGRHEEQEKLVRIIHSPRAEFVAMYGRRRVGKTYLIRAFVKQKKCHYFQLSGEKKASTAQQLKNFSVAFSEVFYEGYLALQTPGNWHDAFQQLTRVIQDKIKTEIIVLFFDELPWLASPRSNFLEALDYYWNQYWVDMPNIKLIVCGSAASWMIKNVVRNKGGLHNRLTARIRLEPFHLKEAQLFLQQTYSHLTHEQLLQIYSVMGGIPYYLRMLDARLSITQNIDKLFFSVEGELFGEFDELFSSLFSDAPAYEEIITILAKHPAGQSRQQLLAQLKLSFDGGNFNKKMQALIEAGFVMELGSFGASSRVVMYKLIDEYSNFYLRWVLPKRKTVERMKALPDYWQTIENSGGFYAWRGQAFEMICCQHIRVITKIAAIKQVDFVGSWSSIPAKGEKTAGAQIDLLFDRTDDAVTICEMKYTDKPLVITKSDAQVLKNKLQAFRDITKTKKHLILVLLSAHGVQENEYSRELLSWKIGIEDVLKAL